MFGKPGLVGKTSIGFNQTEVQMKTNNPRGNPIRASFVINVNKWTHTHTHQVRDSNGKQNLVLNSNVCLPNKFNYIPHPLR